MRQRQRKLATPGSRPLKALARDELLRRFEKALIVRDGIQGAHCVHEIWMRHDPPMVIERMIGLLWRAAPESVPEWLPMRYVEWLPLVYEVASRFQREGRGGYRVYLVLLDYEDSSRGPYGIYVGSTRYTAAERFDQHKAGIRAAGSVLKRGLETLIGPVLHLQEMTRSQAEDVEERLAEALRAEGLKVQGGH